MAEKVAATSKRGPAKRPKAPTTGAAFAALIESLYVPIPEENKAQHEEKET